MFRRERDARRTAKSVRTHEGTMEALRRATSGEYNPNAEFAPKQGDAHFEPALGRKDFNLGGDLVMTSKDGKMFRNNVRKSNARGKTPMPPSGGYSPKPSKAFPLDKPTRREEVDYYMDGSIRPRSARKSQQPDTGNEKETR